MYKFKVVREEEEKYSFMNGVKITSPTKAASLLRRTYDSDINIFEELKVLILNQSNEPVAVQSLSKGGLAATVFDVRLLCKYVIELLGTGVILCHNHPSGGLTPSSTDMAITKKAREALQMFDLG